MAANLSMFSRCRVAPGRHPQDPAAGDGGEGRGHSSSAGLHLVCSVDSREGHYGSAEKKGAQLRCWGSSGGREDYIKMIVFISAPAPFLGP